MKRLRNVLRTLGDRAFFANFRKLLRARMRFDTFLLMRFEPGATPLLQSAWVHPDHNLHAALDEYCSRSYLFDPFFQHTALPQGGALYHISDIAPDRFFSSEYYLEYYRETGLCDEIGLLVPLPAGARAHISISREGNAGPFRRREIQCLKHHAPLLLELLTQHSMALSAQVTKQDPAVQSQPLPALIHGQSAEMFGVRLTQRETEVAAMVLQGHSNRSAGMQLGIAPETCKVHRRNLYRKLSISSQAQLFAMLKHLL